VRRDVDRLTGSLGIDGIFCGGVMGEFWSLAGSERRRLVEITVDSTRGRCPVIAHTGHSSAQQALELTRHAQKAGADFAVLINPYFPPASDEGLYQWFEFVCDRVDIGVWLFDTAYSGVSLSLGLIERLAAIENVCGIKVGRDHARYLEVLDRVGGEILVCEPNEGTWLENMRDHGQRVFMSSAAPYLYQTPDWQPMRDYTALALSGDFTAAAQVAATLVNGDKRIHLEIGPLNTEVTVGALLAIAFVLAVIRVALQLVVSYFPARIAAMFAGTRSARCGRTAPTHSLDHTWYAAITPTFS